jgi:hypothetical protein
MRGFTLAGWLAVCWLIQRWVRHQSAFPDRLERLSV